MKPLSPDQQQWVDKTMDSLDLAGRVGQMLLPKIDHDGSVDALLSLMNEIPFGGLFVWGAAAAEHRARLARVQENSRIPVVVAADLENGPGYVITGREQFPDTLALGAADDEQLAYTMGKAAAVDGRAAGIHWTFAPVVDVNRNPDNPIANSRSFGDDPERISRLARAIIRGMQDHGLAACSKHFPGDGIDDVDQHATTSVNSLALEEWKALSGRTFADTFADGVMSTMIGHIALPAWDPETDSRGALRPATLSRRIVTDLLRREMGFDGLIVTDDMNMGGAAGYANRRDAMVQCVHAGCDMILFPRMPDTFHFLMDALKSGELAEERVDDAARRVLEFKARLHLHTGGLFGPSATSAEESEFVAASRRIAEEGITLVRDTHGILPLRTLEKGARVLTVTVGLSGLDLPAVDEELRARGFAVEHIAAPGFGAIDPFLDKVDAIFVNFTFRADWAVGSPRSIGAHNRMFMNGFFMEHPRVVFTSFGSPYHLRQFSTFPTYINTHSLSVGSQRAAVRAWLGEIPMTAKSPVGNLTRTF